MASVRPAQEAYPPILANMGGPGQYASNEVEKLASTVYGLKLNEKNLPKQVRHPPQCCPPSAGLLRRTGYGGREVLDFSPPRLPHQAGQEDKSLSQESENSYHQTAGCGGLDGGALLESVKSEG